MTVTPALRRLSGALLALVPVVAVFVLFARNFMSGAIEGAIRG
jgi:ABC-type glycerol-3-phosphate transport system permease component